MHAPLLRQRRRRKIPQSAVKANQSAQRSFRFSNLAGSSQPIHSRIKNLVYARGQYPSQPLAFKKEHLMSKQFSEFTLNFNPGARGNDKAPTMKGKAEVIDDG
jgi:hypothetical protein